MRAAGAAVPHVADRCHQVGRNRKLEQSEKPVTFVLTSVEILQLVAEGEAFVNFPFRVNHEYIGLDAASLTFDDALVVHLVHIHKVLRHRLRPLFLHLQVYIMVICLSHPEKRG